MTPEKPQANAVFEGDNRNIDIALLEDAVVGQQPLDVVEHFEERIAEGLDIVDEFRWQILMYAARPEVGGMHAGSGGTLVEDHQLLALLKAPERRRQRTDIHGLGRDVEEMRQQTADLGIEHANELPRGAAR